MLRKAWLGLIFLLAAPAAAQQASDYFTITPCRLYDSRWGQGPLVGGSDRWVPVANHCGIPPDATAVSATFTAVDPNANGTVTAYPLGLGPTNTHVVGLSAGKTRASHAILGLGNGGQIAFLLQGPMSTYAHVLVDAEGYYRPPAQVLQWRHWEQAIESSADYTASGGSPYRDLDLNVRFTNPTTGEVFTQLAYWVANRQTPRLFKVGAAFPPGTWHWQIESCVRRGVNCLADGWLPDRGSVEVAVSTDAGGNWLYEKGFPYQEETYAESGELEATQRLVYPDGTAFTWIADTAWAAPPREHAGQTSQWAAFVSDRKLKGFTAIQVAPAVSYWERKSTCDDWWLTPALPSAIDFSFYRPATTCDTTAYVADATCPDPEAGGYPRYCDEPVVAYWDKFFDMVKAANDKGMTVAIFGVMNPTGIDRGKPYPCAQSAVRFAKWLAERLRGRHVVYSPSFDDFASKKALIDDVGFALKEAAPPVHPAPKKNILAVHLAGGETRCAEYRSFAQKVPGRGRWLTSYLFQSGHGKSPSGDLDCPGGTTDKLENAMRRARQMPLTLDGYPSPKLPAVNAEGPYDPLDVPSGCVDPADTRERIRQAGYYSALSNGAGFGYGSFHLAFWVNPGASYYGLDSAKDMQRLKGHFKGLNPQSKSDDWILGQPAQQSKKAVLATPDTGRLMAYLPLTPQGTTTSITIDKATAGYSNLTCTGTLWEKWWHDPASTATPKAPVCSSSATTITLTTPPCLAAAGCDWLLKLRRSDTRPFDEPAPEASGERRVLELWEEYNDNDETTAIRAAFRDDEAGTFDLSPAGRAFQHSPRKTELAEGSLVVWEADGLDGSLAGVFGRIVGPDGELRTGVFKINDYTQQDQRQPAVAGARDGKALVVWSSVGQGAGRAGIFGRLVHPVGDPYDDPLEMEFPISESGAGMAQNPQVVAFPGGYWVAWEVFDANAQISSLRLRRVSLDGRPLGREREVRGPQREQVQLLDLEGPGPSGARVRWWRLDPGGRFLGVQAQQVAAD
jgi:hypothetical protein